MGGIRRIAARAGRPEAYHETITRAWFELIRRSDDLARNPELFDKALLGRYYSSAALAAGRERWVEPDLHPLELPPPLPGKHVGDVLRRVPVAVAVLSARARVTVHAMTEFGPVIDTAAAWLGCRVHALHECGDHHIVVGEVDYAGVSEQRPLVRHDSTYH